MTNKEQKSKKKPKQHSVLQQTISPSSITELSSKNVQSIVDSYSREEQKVLGSQGHLIAEWLWKQPAGTYRFPFDDICFRIDDIANLSPDTKNHWENVYGTETRTWFFAMNKPYIKIHDQRGNTVDIKSIHNATNTAEYIAELTKTPLDILLQQILHESFVIDDFAKKSLGIGQETISGTYFNKRALAGEGVQAKFLQTVLQSIGGNTYDQNDFNGNLVDEHTKHFVMRDLLIGILYGKGTYIESDKRITSFAMIPMKLLNNTFVSKEHHDELQSLVESHMRHYCEEHSLNVNDLQSIPWINNRGGNYSICPCVSFTCGVVGNHDGIHIQYIDGNGEHHAMPPIILGTTNVAKSLGWSKYLDCICDYVLVPEGKNKIESLFAGIETLSPIDGVFEPKEHNDANPHYMIDNILVEQGLLYAKIPNNLKKKTREEKLAIRKKFLERRPSLLKAVYNNPYFHQSGSHRLDVSMQQLIATEKK